MISFSTPEPIIYWLQEKLCKRLKLFGHSSSNRGCLFLFQDGADSLGASDHERNILLFKQAVQSWLFLYARMEDKYPLLSLQFLE